MFYLGRGYQKFSQSKIFHLRKTWYCSKEHIFWWAMSPIALLFHVKTKFSKTTQTFSIDHFNEENVFKVHNFITPLRIFLAAGFQTTVWSFDSDITVALCLSFTCLWYDMVWYSYAMICYFYAMLWFCIISGNNFKF